MLHGEIKLNDRNTKIHASIHSNKHCVTLVSLQWRHNERESVSNHQPHHCLLNRLFRRRSEKTSKLRVTGLCVGNSPGPVNSPHKWPVTRKMFPCDDVIMLSDGLLPSSWQAITRTIDDPVHWLIIYVTRTQWVSGFIYLLCFTLYHLIS